MGRQALQVKYALEELAPGAPDREQSGEGVSMHEGGETQARPGSPQDETPIWLELGCSNLQGQGRCLDRPESPRTVSPPAFVLGAT